MTQRERIDRTLALTLLGLSLGAQADSAPPVYDLGVINVTATPVALGAIGTDQVSSLVTLDEIRRFNRDNVGDALDLLSGVTVSTNSRNEKTVFVRGFDSRQVPLFIDGIPVYVPYDGTIDFNRFTTADLSAIQVAKGFSSVAYGPNALGGASNLTSRKPTAKLEGDVSLGVGDGNERSASANVGSNQGLWYVQAGASWIDSDFFRLAADFTPTATEDGGRRNNSDRSDDKLSLKVGLTPNATDEYALSYYRQNGDKGQPPSTDPATTRYWRWPYWNKESLYFISNTALGASESVKLRLYHDAYDNAVASYTDDSYSKLKTSGKGSVGATGKSVYNDRTLGGSAELRSTRLSRQDIGLSVQLKQDTQSATNGQAGLFWDLDRVARLYATVATKSRFPTLKDRYSLRLGTAIPNPDLQMERSINYEIGYQGNPWGQI